MSEVLSRTDPPSGLTTPARNRYFYGKLLDVVHLDLEQAYGNRKRWWLNRLVLGSGVVSGLRFATTEEGMVQFGAGLAIDQHGREVVVPAVTSPVDPRQPTDGGGRPAGAPVPPGSWVTISLAYHESETDHVPVPPCDNGDGGTGSEAGTIRESYRLLVAAAEGEGDGGDVLACTRPGLWRPGPGGAGWQPDPDELAGLIGEPGPEVTGDGRIPLAQVRIPEPDGEPVLRDRRVPVYRNPAVMEAVTCLAARVSGSGGEPPPPPDLPRVTAVSWRHGEPVPPEELASNGIRIGFSRPVAPLPGPASGWFQVTLEYRETADNPVLATTRLDTVSATMDRVGLHFVPDLRRIPPPASDVVVRLVLKSHVLHDERGLPLDGTITAALPPGTRPEPGPVAVPLPGRDFESWFLLSTGAPGRASRRAPRG